VIEFCNSSDLLPKLNWKAEMLHITVTKPLSNYLGPNLSRLPDSTRISSDDSFFRGWWWWLQRKKMI